MKKQTNINHTATIKEFIKEVTDHSDFTVNETDGTQGVRFDYPGHSLLVWNDGTGWLYELRSDFSPRPIKESYDYHDSPLEALKDCISPTNPIIPYYSIELPIPKI